MLSIFVGTLTPVLLIVAIGFVVGRRSGVDHRGAARLLYVVLAPAFIFDLLADAEIEAGTVGRIVTVTLATTLVALVIAVVAAKVLRRPGPVAGAYGLIAVYGNVGNFGLPVILFEFGQDALPLAAIVFVVINVAGFLVGITAANWHAVNPATALFRAFSSPMVLAMFPALAFNLLDLTLPLPLERSVTLLAGGMIPVLLLILGLQLANMGRPRFGRDVLVASGIRLLIAPAVAAVAAGLIGLDGDPRGVTIVQSAMPAAVLTTLIAIEHDLEPELVTTVVLFTTLVSAVTLTIVLALV